MGLNDHLGGANGTGVSRLGLPHLGPHVGGADRLLFVLPQWSAYPKDVVFVNPHDNRVFLNIFDNLGRCLLLVGDGGDRKHLLQGEGGRDHEEDQQQKRDVDHRRHVEFVVVTNLRQRPVLDGFFGDGFLGSFGGHEQMGISMYRKPRGR